MNGFVSDVLSRFFTGIPSSVCNFTSAGAVPDQLDSFLFNVPLRTLSVFDGSRWRHGDIRSTYSALPSGRGG